MKKKQYLCSGFRRKDMKTLRNALMALVLLASTMGFVACNPGEQNNPEEVAVLFGCTWRYVQDANNTMWFEFAENEFVYHDEATVSGMTFRTWYKGTYTFKDNTMTLKYKEASSDDLNAAMRDLSTTATLNADNTISYMGHVFTKQQK